VEGAEERERKNEIGFVGKGVRLSRRGRGREREKEI